MRLITSNDTTEECARKASACVTQYANPKDLVHEISVQKLLEFMLEGAKISGGERYTACAILACEEESDPRQKLKDLADDWIVFLLWPCKSTSSVRNFTNTRDCIEVKGASRSAELTSDDTSPPNDDVFESPCKERPGSFRSNVSTTCARDTYCRLINPLLASGP